MPKGGCHNKKPTKLKVLQGTARKDRMPANEPQPTPIAPEMPKGLDRYAKQCWQRNVPILERLGLLTEADMEMFISYCQAWSRYCHANKRLKKVLKEADDIEVIRRAEVSVEKAEHSVRLLANEFGLSPASRSRLSVEVKNDEEGILEKIWSTQS